MNVRDRVTLCRLLVKIDENKMFCDRNGLEDATVLKEADDFETPDMISGGTDTCITDSGLYDS